MDWSAPKSVRQIGDTKGKTKIYVEDYVMSFARRLVRERRNTEIGGVLLAKGYTQQNWRTWMKRTSF